MSTPGCRASGRLIRSCGLSSVTTVYGSTLAVSHTLDPTTAWLCAPGDPASLALALRHALDAGERKRAEVGARGRALHESRFTPLAIGTECQRLLVELIAAGGNGIRPSVTTATSPRAADPRPTAGAAR